jgi:hypothetical protein
VISEGVDGRLYMSYFDTSVSPVDVPREQVVGLPSIPWLMRISGDI